MVATVVEKVSPNVPQLVSKKRPEEINFHDLCLTDDIGDLTLREAYQYFVLDDQSDIPFLIWLLENPKSMIALPGNVDLYGHDCIHLLLNRGVSNFDEAFIIGFTMGNTSEVKDRHISIFRTFSTLLYPRPFRFNKYHLKSFELGLAYGQKVAVKNINRIDFGLYADTTLNTLRETLGISIQELQKICYVERLWMQLDTH